MTWNSTALKRALKPGGRAAGLIKGEVANEPDEGLYPGYSASGQDVWLERAQFSGPGLVLSAVGARCGRVFEADGRWGTVANTVVLLPRPGYDHHFLWYLVNNEDFWEKGGAAQPYVRVAETLERRLTLPPLNTQRAIADYLDRETARIDALIEKKQRMVELLEEQFESWREEMIVGRTIIDWTPLHHLTDPYRPIVYGIVQAGENIVGGVPYIKTGDLLDLRPERLSRTTCEIDEAYRRARVYPGDLVVAMRASIGLPVVVPPDLPVANLTQGTARVAVHDGVDGTWLYHALMTRAVQEQCHLRAVGTTFKTLNIWDLRRIRIPMPPAEGQQLLGRKIEHRAGSLAEAVGKLNRQLQMLGEHRQTLITAAVTGELEIPGVAA